MNKRPYINSYKDKDFATRAIRAGIARTPYNEHSPAMFLSSGFMFDNAESMRQIFADQAPGCAYARYRNPGTEELICKLASLERCEDGVVTASGMAAIFLCFLSFLQQGDHLLATRSMFGATYKMLLDVLPRWGIEVTLIDPVDSNSWKAALRPNTKMFFIETPTNPGLEIIDLAAARALCDIQGTLLVVDNCFATPCLQQPVDFGCDVIIHSATKFIDGQGRVLGGALLGSSELIEPCYKMLRSTGATLSAFNAWLLARSLDTLQVRMERHCANAIELARRLEQHPAARNVRYPFLPSHPQHQLATRQMRLGGALVTFELPEDANGEEFLDAIELLSLSANLGDTRSIITHPASTTHARLSEDERRSMGIFATTVRVSAGLESCDDIYADIAQALERIFR